MKHLKHLFTALLLLFSVAVNAHDFEVNGIYYNITDEANKTVEVTYKGYASDEYTNEYTGNVEISESVTYNGTTYSVTSIRSFAFDDCSGLTRIIIPRTITVIGSLAFENCYALKTVINYSGLTLVKGSTAYGYLAFYADNVINTSNPIIDGDFMFDKLNGVNTLLVYLGDDANITLPQNCNGESYVIGENAFSNNKTLVSVTIPNKVTSIGSSAFSSCSTLASITISGSVTSIGSSAFDGCSALTTITIPSSVTGIGASAFKGCSALKSMTIPGSVTSIGDCAFNGCSSLKDLRIEDGKSTLSLGYAGSYGDGLFKECQLKTLYLGRNLSYNTEYSHGYSPFADIGTLTSVTIGNSVTNIGNRAFYDCGDLASIVIPNSVTSIGNSAFGLCYDIVAVYISDISAWCNINFKDEKSNPLFISLSSRDNLYLNNELVTDLVIPDGVTKIKKYAFSGYSKLTSVTIPNSVTSIEENVFEECPKLTTVHICDLAAWCNIDFKNKSSNPLYCAKNLYLNRELVTELVIPNSIVKIKNYTFSGSTAITNVIIPDGVTSIGNEAFSGCTGLASVEIPNSVTSIGDSAFSGCSGLTSITIGNAVTSIGASAFSGCTGLASVEIPNSVTSIGDSAFNGCSGLTSITIGNAVTSIGASAFSGCTGLASVEIPNSVKSIGDNSFENCSNVETLYIGSAIESIGDNAFVGCNDIYKIIMGSKKAIEANENIFTDDVYYNASLYVLKDRIYAFENRVPWNKFHIVENGFTVTFKVDGEIYKSYTLEYGTAIPVETPAKKGYTFSGWNEIPATMPAEDITVEGSFAVNYYAVTYIVDGEEYETMTIEYGKEITLPATPEKEGHTFSGWSEVPATMPAEDITVTGSFAVNYYAVTYIVDGEEYETMTVEYGKEITLPATPEKEGHTFSGWSEVPATMPAEDITVTGSFVVNYYAVTYIVDGEEYETMTIEYGKEITLPATPEKEGHTFSGWSEVPATMPAEDITVTGSFAVNYYAVTYIVDGEEYETMTVEYGKEITLPATPEKEGHTFSGWSEVPATMPAEDITVTGSFVVNYYTVTYMVDGEVYATDSVAYGDEVVLIDEPVREGYTFSGWSEVPETMPAEDITVDGSFTKIETSIDQVLIDSGEVVIYDLKGLRIVDVHELKRGVYIVNGKKVVK